MQEISIRYGSSNPTKTFEVNSLEQQFFEKLISKFQDNSLNRTFDFVRMSSGAISVSYASYPIGKVKLQGKKFWMQILKGKYDNKTIEGDIDLFISKLDEWVKYTQWCLK